MFHPEIIKSGITEHMANRKVMDGIIHSAVISEFNRSAIDGLVQSAQPSRGPALETMKKLKASPTKGSPGYRHYPGSSFA
jgi:hypothetical protein